MIRVGVFVPIDLRTSAYGREIGGVCIYEFITCKRVLLKECHSITVNKRAKIRVKSFPILNYGLVSINPDVTSCRELIP